MKICGIIIILLTTIVSTFQFMIDDRQKIFHLYPSIKKSISTDTLWDTCERSFNISHHLRTISNNKITIVDNTFKANLPYIISAWILQYILFCIILFKIKRENHAIRIGSCRCNYIGNNDNEH